MIQQLDFWVFHSKSENINWKKYIHFHAFCSIIYNGQYMEAT